MKKYLISWLQEADERLKFTQARRDFIENFKLKQKKSLEKLVDLEQEIEEEENSSTAENSQKLNKLMDKREQLKEKLDEDWDNERSKNGEFSIPSWRKLYGFKYSVKKNKPDIWRTLYSKRKIDSYGFNKRAYDGEKERVSSF